MEILKKVLNHINRHNLISSGDSLICAVSGGADSICMLDILSSLKEELNLTLYVAHLNHGLRGKEALRDEEFVKDFCLKHSLPFYSKEVDVNELSKKLKLSCEEAGRFARYEFFDELRNELNVTKIATAHNKNDNIETVLMRILRGTDVKGLSGIPALNSNNVVRPILCLTRDEIEEYLRCKGVDFVTDSTNFENIFTRNKIRNSLIPLIISDYNESFIESFSRNIETFSECNDYLENTTEESYKKLVSNEFYGLSVKISALLTESSYIAKKVIKKAIYNLTGSNITTNLLNIIFESLSNDNSVTVSDALSIYIKSGMLHFVLTKEIPAFSYTFNDAGKYYIPEISAVFEISEYEGIPEYSNKNTVYFSREIMASGITLRSRKCGDVMNLANCGSKKIKDILIDEKIPAFLKDYYPVLVHDDKIIWLVGVRDDIAFREGTDNRYIKITFSKEKNNA